MDPKSFGNDPKNPRGTADGARKLHTSLRGPERAATPAQKTIAEHTVAAGETLSHISLKYYGSAVKDKWMQIYEANKAAIGDDPGRLKVGMVLKIPEKKA